MNPQHSLMKKYLVISVLLSLFSLSFAQSPKAVRLFEKGKKAMKEGFLIDATVQFTDAISLYSAYATAYDLRGRCFQRIGEATHAQQDFAKAASLDPSLIVPLVRMIDLGKQAQDWQSVMKYARMIYDNHPENQCPAMYEMGAAHDQLAAQTEASEWYHTFLEANCEGMEEQAGKARARVAELDK